MIDDTTSFTINVSTGKHYYVSTTGSDSNDGSLAHPWKTIQKAANTLTAGQTVHIMAGTYYEQVVGKNSGTTGNPITFTNYNGGKAIIDGTGMTSTWDGLVVFRGQHHIRMSGLTIANASAYGLMFPGSEGHSNDITIDNCEIYGCSLSGIYFYPANPNYIENVLIENCVIYDNQNWWNHPGHGPNETVTISNVNGFIFRNNYLYNNHKLPVDCKNNARNGQIYENIMDTNHTLNNGGGGFYIDAYDDHAMDIDIFSNIVYGPETGFTLGTEQGGTLERIRLFNNIYYGTGSAFQINNMWHTLASSCATAMCAGDISLCCETPGMIPGASPHLKTDCSIINNTVYNANWGFRLNDRPESYLNQNFVVRNNIFYSTNGITKGSGNVDFSKIVIDHNLFKVGATGDTMGTNYLQADPKFVDKVNNNFHLQPTSPCINTGNNQNAPTKDFDGNNRDIQVDIGAFEYLL